MTFRRLIPFLLLAVASCADDTGDEYTRLHAFLRITPVTALSPLHEALNNPGHYCTLTYDANNYIATRPNGTNAPLPRTALEPYGRPMCIEGFLLGTPSVPNLKGQFYQTCYELACPTCYDQDAVQRRLTLRADETVYCSRCHRTYSLRNSGIVTDGEKGSILKRYRIASYANDILIVSN